MYKPLASWTFNLLKARLHLLRTWLEIYLDVTHMERTRSVHRITEWFRLDHLVPRLLSTKSGTRYEMSQMGEYVFTQTPYNKSKKEQPILHFSWPETLFITTYILNMHFDVKSSISCWNASNLHLKLAVKIVFSWKLKSYHCSWL